MQRSPNSDPPTYQGQQTNYIIAHLVQLLAVHLVEGEHLQQQQTQQKQHNTPTSCGYVIVV
jgi:hypothetical protein